MENQVTTVNAGVRYGIFIGIAMIAYSLILQVSGQVTNTWLGLVSYIILIAGIVLAHNYYKSMGDGYMTLGQGLGIGMVICAIAGIFSSIFSYIYIKFVDDSIITKSLEEARIKMEQQNMSDEQIDQALSITEKFTSPFWLFIIGFISILFFGFLISLLVSLFTKKNNPQFEV
ncbi:MAG: DUF4199 domain-containing protein [Cyclobacteriaceae bacterium]